MKITSEIISPIILKKEENKMFKECFERNKSTAWFLKNMVFSLTKNVLKK